MNTKDLVEKLSEKVHDALIEKMSEQGYHNPSHHTDGRFCSKCYTDMVPYDKLPGEHRQYNRSHVSSVLQALDNLGIKLDDVTTNKKVNGNLNSGHIFEMVGLKIISPLEAREILQVDSLFPDNRPICPDCKTIMVKTHIELSDGSGWFSGWACDCKYEECL